MGRWLSVAVVSAAIIFAHAMAARAGAYEAEAAYKQGDYARAYSECLADAQAGDAACETLLGVLYSEGQGVKADPAQAVHWFERAAVEGSAAAAYNLGRAYELGQGVAANPSAAEKWYRVAATEGLPQAQLALGMLANGRRDAKTAIKWFRAAAKAGLPAAQYMLGTAYQNGTGLRKNARSAAKWYTAAATRGFSPAQSRLGDLYERGKGVAKDLAQAYFWHAVALRDSKDPDKKRDQAALRRLAKHLSDAQVAEAKANAEKFQAEAVEIRVTKHAARKRGTGLAQGGKDHQPLLYGTGSGFYVARNGQILTNNHVVTACREVRITETGKDLPAKIVATDAVRDLALLQGPHAVADTAVFRGTEPLQPGETVVAVGFPLQGILTSDPIVTTGIVNALAGPRDDRRLMQISAPVQPGNSGGPLLDASGHVVGVVVSTLSTMRVAEMTGAIPENINFAIKAGEARDFLKAHGVAVETAPRGPDLSTEAVAARALDYTKRLECWR